MTRPLTYKEVTAAIPAAEVFPAGNSDAWAIGPEGAYYGILGFVPDDALRSPASAVATVRGSRRNSPDTAAACGLLLSEYLYQLDKDPKEIAKLLRDYRDREFGEQTDGD